MNEPVVFLYNVELFRKKLLRRTITVVSLFIIFVIYNSLQVPGEERPRFFMVFGPLLALFFWFLSKNYKKQVEILSSGKVEISGGMLKQFDANGNCATVRLKDIESITSDKFRSYDRIVIETSEKIHPLVNIKDRENLIKILERESGVVSKIDPVEVNLFHSKTIYYFIPSILLAIAFLIEPIRERWKFLTADLCGLVLSINMLLYLLYQPEKENHTINQFSLKRRLLFISFVVFIFQVYTHLKNAGLINSN